MAPLKRVPPSGRPGRHQRLCGAFRAAAVERVWHEIKSQDQNLVLEAVTLSVGAHLCPYGIVYRRAYDAQRLYQNGN
jgi:hypothetical protein